MINNMSAFAGPIGPVSDKVIDCTYGFNRQGSCTEQEQQPVNNYTRLDIEPLQTTYPAMLPIATPPKGTDYTNTGVPRPTPAPTNSLPIPVPSTPVATTPEPRVIPTYPELLEIKGPEEIPAPMCLVDKPKKNYWYLWLLAGYGVAKLLTHKNPVK